MAVIQQLSAHVADLIAAGEVVERPASVVKELLENAVDAGAKHIAVEIQNGGMTFLRVTDDGCGMAPDDAETAFLRHATSKLRNADDLASIVTMGFRGEALAAIASVSRIDLLTRLTGAASGTSLHLEGGKITERSEAGCPDGTTILVRDLFFNTPARMKFMKSDATEGSHVFAAVQRQALSHPDVAIRFLKDGQEALSTPGDGDLRSAVYCVYGRQFSAGLVPVESYWENYTLRGFVGKPTATRGNRSGQHFFVGGRPVKSKLLTSAFEQAYQNQMMQGRFPCCVLHLDLPPHLVDVNVHPAKTEVRFLSERAVFDAVHYGVLGALSHTVDRPELKLAKDPAPAAAPQPRQDFFKTMDASQFRDFAKTVADAPRVTPKKETMETVFRPRTVEPPAPAVSVAPAKPVQPAEPQPAPAAEAEERLDFLPTEAEMLSFGAPAATETSESVPAEPVQQSLPMPEVPDYRIVGEVLDTYILIEQDGQLLFLDKHAAHERLLFEKLRASEKQIMGQQLLTPIPVEVSRQEAAALLENAALLEQFAFTVEEFGDGAVMVRQIPADLPQDQAEATLQSLATDLAEGRRADLTSLRDHILHSIACKAAIKAGWHTTEAERADLVAQVLYRPDIQHCPHGRPVCITVTRSQLERRFGRG